MNRQRIHKLLRDSGLTEKQSVAYFAALQLGRASIRELASRSGLNRTTLYDIVDQLCSLGLLAKEGKGWGITFIAAPPESLRRLLEAKNLALENALPELNALYSAGPLQGEVSRVDGTDGIRSAYMTTLGETRLDDFYLVMSDLEKWLSRDPDFFREFARKRSRRIKGTRLLAVPSPHAELRRREGDNLRLLPASMKLQINLVITPQRVLLHQTSAPEHLLIFTGTPVIEMQRQIFEVLWHQAK